MVGDGNLPRDWIDGERPSRVAADDRIRQRLTSIGVGGAGAADDRAERRVLGQLELARGDGWRAIRGRRGWLFGLIGGGDHVRGNHAAEVQGCIIVFRRDDPAIDDYVVGDRVRVAILAANRVCCRTVVGDLRVLQQLEVSVVLRLVEHGWRADPRHRDGLAIERARAIDTGPGQDGHAVADGRDVFILGQEVSDQIVDSGFGRGVAVVVIVAVIAGEGVLVHRGAPAADEDDGRVVGRIDIGQGDIGHDHAAARFARAGVRKSGIGRGCRNLHCDAGCFQANPRVTVFAIVKVLPIGQHHQHRQADRRPSGRAIPAIRRRPGGPLAAHCETIAP